MGALDAHADAANTSATTIDDVNIRRIHGPHVTVMSL